MLELSMFGSNSSSTSLNVETDSVTSNGKKALKEGAVQMTSLSTLLSHHRYFFLYHDTLVVSKQKGACSFKLKDKLRLEKVWIASSNTTDSFLIGWPLTNYLVHFRNREEKEEWFELFSYCVQQCLRPCTTTISMDINVRGRKQVIRRRIDNGKKSGELVVETAADLGLPHTSYELRITVGDGAGKALQGPENVYTVIMNEIERHGIRLSESQKQSLDTCPIANAKLILSNIKSTKTSPMHIVNSIKKRVLQRTETRGIFGKELDGPTPPQPIMTIVDHLRMQGYDAEGIFRKSPKQSTLKELRTELEKGLVPDYHKYSTHVLASMLKDYLRSIPGKILLSGNYEMWMKEVANEPDIEKKLTACRNLLSLLPTSHSILLANVLKLLHKIATSPSSKMTASSLSVCLAPSFLESSDAMESGKKIPPLVEFLISNAADVMPGFNADNVFSILNPVDHNANHVCSASPTCSDTDDNSSQTTPIIEELTEDSLSQCSIDNDSSSTAHLAVSSPLVRQLETISEGTEEPLAFSSDSEDDDGTLTHSFVRSPFLSNALRSQNSEVKNEKKAEDKKIEERKVDTPRSPCLKRIHFQRTEAQHRSNAIFQYDSRLEFKFEKKKEEKITVPEPVEPVVIRKQSREEATQTNDCGLPELKESATLSTDSERRFPAFRSSFIETTDTPSSPRMIRHESTSLLAVPSDPAPRPKYPIVLENRVTPESRVIAPLRPEPSLRSITDRLVLLREHIREEALTDYRPPPPNCLSGMSGMPSPDLRRFTEEQPPHRESPRFVRKNYVMPEPPGLYRPQATVPPLVHNPSPAPIEQMPTLIREKFQPYCIEPNVKEIVPPEPTMNFGIRKPELQRSASQRGGRRTQAQRDLQRASSVKSGRRVDKTGESCVGMDALEINWSVRQLKTLFQDRRPPAINTDYNMS